jgi:hypothetical protein
MGPARCRRVSSAFLWSRAKSRGGRDGKRAQSPSRPEPSQGETVIKLARTLIALLFRPFAGPKAVAGGSGKWVDNNPNESYGSDGE